MHPALSIIVFTTASGAGYGLLALLGVLAPAGLIPNDRWLGGVGLGLALALISGGLMASTAHLGRPERAWRAFSQWRSSWLSREAVLSVATFIPAGVFTLGWAVFGRLDGMVAMAGLLAAVGAAATVSATAMIYASLRPVANWASRYTLPAYLIFALMTGAVLLNALLHLFGYGDILVALPAALAIALGWAWKTATWRHDDARALPATAESATGLFGGRLHTLEWPHTEENYILKEMAYRLARKHAEKLRRLVHLLAFAAPLALTLGAVLAGGKVAAVLALCAVFVQAPGMLIERWLFFAQARHVVSLYYMPQEGVEG